MGLAILPAPPSASAVLSSFSSLFIGMGLAIEGHSPDRLLPSEGLSVPFSSGWALRFFQRTILASRQFYFQFPFHRDGPCDFKAYSCYFPHGLSFSSLFIGMGLAINFVYSVGPCPMFTFSSLFIGMGLAMCHLARLLPGSRSSFQFPFHRDGPCDQNWLLMPS